MSETIDSNYDTGYIWSHNDSRETAKIFKIFPNNSAVLQVTTANNYNNRD